MTTFINITTNSVIAQERYWSFHRPVIELSGHMNFTSPFESSDSCNTCDGARCDYCEKVVTAGHFEFSVNSDELFRWMLEANVPENVATEIAFGERGHSYNGYRLKWPTEETLAEEFPEFYNTLTSPDGEVMDVIESFRGQFDTFHALREAVFAHFGLDKYRLSGHVYNQLEMYWCSCGYDHKKACAFSDDHNVDAELTADAELTVHEEEADYMCTLKYDHGIEIFMSHNPNAGCNSGEYHTLYINGVALDACRCGNGCHHTAAINRLEDEEYVLFLLGEVEFDPREESASLSAHSTEPETKTSLQLEYEAARQRILDSGVKVPEDQFYYEVLTSVHRVDSFTVIVRKFMMPEDFAAEMKLKKLRLVHEGGTLADFKDVDIIDVFSCDKDTLHTVIQWVKRWGCISVEELFQEDTVESSVELKEIDKPQEEEDQTESLQDLKEFRDLIEILNATSAELMSSEEEAAIMESYREFRKVMNKKRGKR